jgi:hypothetical protein
MFVIEKLLNDHRAAVERWEIAREKWKGEHDYYSNSDYEERYPRPLNWVKVIARSTVIGVAVGLFMVVFIGFLKEIKVEQQNKPKEETAQAEGKNCKYFNKNDYVRIQYGDYANINGRIIGGCEEHNDYQVKLDENSWANLPSDGNESAVDVGGRTISVDSYKNLAVVEDKKEEKKE